MREEPGTMSGLLSARETAAELRLYALGSSILEKFKASSIFLRDQVLKHTRSKSVAEFYTFVFSFLILLGVLCWSLTSSIRNSLGDIVLIYQAFLAAQQFTKSALQSLAKLYGHSFFLADVFGFLDLSSSIKDPKSAISLASKMKTGIEFKGVDFKYPDSDRLILNRLSLEIPPQATIAILGKNGAGKSTLIKLLSRLYDPNSGQIMIDGTDIRDYKVSELRDFISIMCQEPIRFSDTLEQSILKGSPGIKRSSLF